MTLPLPSVILIYAPDDHLLITPERYHEWQDHAEKRGIIIWNREGQARVIDADVLDNALHIFREYTIMLQSGRLAGEMPQSADRIAWSQTRLLPTTHYPVKVK